MIAVLVASAQSDVRWGALLVFITAAAMLAWGSHPRAPR